MQLADRHAHRAGRQRTPNVPSDETIDGGIVRIHDDHLYHGAVLIQIAEHASFTAINSFKLASGTSRSAYRINDDMGVYLKYASKPKGPFKEYAFTFHEPHLAELKEISKTTSNVLVALVCVRYANGADRCASRREGW